MSCHLAPLMMPDCNMTCFWPDLKHGCLCPSADMVDTQTLGWSMGFGLTALELEELDNSSHGLDLKPYSMLDYTNLSGMEYDPSLTQGDYSHADQTHMYSYRQQESQSGCSDWLAGRSPCSELSGVDVGPETSKIMT